MPILILTAAVLALQPTPPPAATQAVTHAAAPEPIVVAGEEAYAHRVAGADYIRIARTHSDPHGAVLDLTIDEIGRVAVAVVRQFDGEAPVPERIATRMIEAARQWRFRPFIRGGRPVPIRARFDIDFFPPARLPTAHVPMPAAAPMNIAVTLTRDPCFGGCPAYAVTVHGDGRVRFEGWGDVIVPGVREYRIPAAQAEALIEQFRAADFWSLDDAYRGLITDHPTQYLTVTAGRRSKSVEDYAGLRAGMPDVVIALERAVDAAAGTERWVTGNAQTIDALAAQGFDFTSHDAADIAVAAAFAAPEVTIALLDRGVPLDSRPVCDGCSVPSQRFRLLLAAVARPGPLFDRLDRDAYFAGLDAPALRRLLNDAARRRNLHAVERLLARGADRGLSDETRRSLVQIAREQGWARVQALLAREADR